MSEHGVHVHPPHEEAVHHAAAHHSLSQWVAIFTALLAALGAVVGYQGSQLMHEVLLFKNDAVLQKAHATDAWNHYQATSTKLHLMELSRDLAPASRRDAIEAKIAKYDAQKQQIKSEADALEAKSVQAEEHAEQLDRPHLRLAHALIALQIAISLASITALTGRTWLFVAALLSAAAGAGLWLDAVRLVGL